MFIVLMSLDLFFLYVIILYSLLIIFVKDLRSSTLEVKVHNTVVNLGFRQLLHLILMKILPSLHERITIQILTLAENGFG
jgi:hypothetical protein